MECITLAICVHVLGGVFWAGSTMAFAVFPNRSRGFFAAQMTAGLVVIAAGSFLWNQLHEGLWGPTERALTVGAVSALAALLVQATFVGVPLVRLAQNGPDTSGALLQGRIVHANRFAATLLAVAVAAMAASRYAS